MNEVLRLISSGLHDIIAITYIDIKKKFSHCKSQVAHAYQTLHDIFLKSQPSLLGTVQNFVYTLLVPSTSKLVN